MQGPLREGVKQNLIVADMSVNGGGGGGIDPLFVIKIVFYIEKTS